MSIISAVNTVNPVKKTAAAKRPGRLLWHTSDARNDSLISSSTEQEKLLRHLVLLTSQAEFRSPTWMSIVFSR